MFSTQVCALVGQPMLCSAQVSLEFRLPFRSLLCVIALIVSSNSAYSQNGNIAHPQEGYLGRLIHAVSRDNDSRPEILHFQSRFQQSLGDHNQALQLAEAAVKANPRNAGYHLQLARVLSDETNTAKLFRKIWLAKRIRAELETALKLEPANPNCLFGMMMYYEQAPAIVGGSRERAHQLANQIATIDRSKGYLAQAQLAGTEKTTVDLEDLYLKAFQADPTSFDALGALAGFYVSEAQKKKYEFANR